MKRSGFKTRGKPLARGTGFKRSQGLIRGKRLKGRSAKGTARARNYAALRLVFLHNNPRCQRCGCVAMEIHHKRGRGPYLLDVTTWAALCSPCHLWIHANPAEAGAAGWLLDRLKKV